MQAYGGGRQVEVTGTKTMGNEHHSTHVSSPTCLCMFVTCFATAWLLNTGWVMYDCMDWWQWNGWFKGKYYLCWLNYLPWHIWELTRYSLLFLSPSLLLLLFWPWWLLSHIILCSKMLSNSRSEAGLDLVSIWMGNQQRPPERVRKEACLKLWRAACLSESTNIGPDAPLV